MTSFISCNHCSMCRLVWQTTVFSPIHHLQLFAMGHQCQIISCNYQMSFGLFIDCSVLLAHHVDSSFLFRKLISLRLDFSFLTLWDHLCTSVNTRVGAIKTHADSSYLSPCLAIWHEVPLNWLQAWVRIEQHVHPLLYCCHNFPSHHLIAFVNQVK